MDQGNLGAWIGRSQQDFGSLDVGTALRACATLMPEAAGHIRNGDPMPPLWHWFAFVPSASMTELGNDGHPKFGRWLPALHHDRRVWTGGEVSFLGRLHVGEALERTSTILSIHEEQGMRGHTVHISVEHRISGEAGLAVVERQDVAYLPIPDAFVPPEAEPAPDSSDFEHRVTVSEPLLFRYSALTFNAHRIHYDLPYAQEVEKYPGLVLHAPLQAQLLMHQAVAHRGEPPRHFAFEGIHPMFHHDEVRLMGIEESDGRMQLCTAASAGHQGMRATATWEEAMRNAA